MEDAGRSMKDEGGGMSGGKAREGGARMDVDWAHSKQEPTHVMLLFFLFFSVLDTDMNNNTSPWQIAVFEVVSVIESLSVSVNVQLFLFEKPNQENLEQR